VGHVYLYPITRDHDLLPNRITPNTKNAWIDNTDQLSSQPIRGIHIANIPAKVVSVDCIHITGLSIKRGLLLPAIT